MKWLIILWTVFFCIVVVRLLLRQKATHTQTRLCAEQGDPEAQLNLGLMYHEGKGLPQSYATAVEWYRKAAEQGFPQAQFNLGMMYYGGRGVHPNFVQAYMWFNLAAAHGNEGASKFRDMVAKKMTREQIAKAEVMTRNWKPS